MPVLKNAKHERFAQELAKGKTATEAYVLAGYKPNDGNAATLKGNQRISDRISELLSKGAERAAVTIESLIGEAEEARQGAMDAGQYAAAISAIKEKGVLAGLRVEKSERAVKTDATQLTDAELDAAIASALAREEAAELDPSQFN